MARYETLTKYIPVFETRDFGEVIPGRIEGYTIRVGWIDYSESVQAFLQDFCRCLKRLRELDQVK